MFNAKCLGFKVMPIIASGCMIASGCCMQGSGHVTEESRAISSFDKIHIDISANIVITAGESDDLTVRTDDNLMDHVETRVVNDTLIIKSNVHECLDSTEMEIRVSTPTLSEVKIDGSSDVTINGDFASTSMLFSIDGSGDIRADETLSADLFSIQIDGSGDMHFGDIDVNEIRTTIDGNGNIALAGVAPIQSIDIDGSGKIEAYDLETKSTGIRIDGSGTCKVNVSEDLTVHIAGSGTVYYVGSPNVDQSIDGSGTVKAAK